MDQEKPKRTGRPRVIQGESATMMIRLGKAQRDKVDRLGGSAWIRARIDEAPEPGEATRARGPWLEKDEG